MKRPSHWRKIWVNSTYASSPSSCDGNSLENVIWNMKWNNLRVRWTLMSRVCVRGALCLIFSTIISRRLCARFATGRATVSVRRIAWLAVPASPCVDLHIFGRPRTSQPLVLEEVFVNFLLKGSQPKFSSPTQPRRRLARAHRREFFYFFRSKSNLCWSFVYTLMCCELFSVTINSPSRWHRKFSTRWLEVIWKT